MNSAPWRALAKALRERFSGSRPGAPRAFGIAVGVGFAAAVATYRALRSGD